jgi:glycine/D-amino acid oxidase-like deaminating enzyme
MSASGNFIIDRCPGFSNVWVAGGGTAGGFKFGPVLGEYIAKRVLGIEDDPRLARAFPSPDIQTLQHCSHAISVAHGRPSSLPMIV